MPFPPEQQLRQIGPALDCLLALLDGEGLSDTPVGQRPSIAMRVRAVIDAVLPAAIDAAVAERLPAAIKAANARHRAALDELRGELAMQRELHDEQLSALAVSVAEQMQAQQQAHEQTVAALPLADLRATCDTLVSRVEALPLMELRASISDVAQRVAQLESSPPAVVVTPTVAEPPATAATLRELIAGVGDGFVTSSVAAQYIAREINAAIARAKG